MLTPKHLKKISLEAIERKKKEKLEEIERAKREEEERIYQDNLKLEIKKQERRRQKILNLSIARTTIEIIKLSASGSSKYTTNPKSFILDDFIKFYRNKGYTVAIKSEDFCNSLKERIKNSRLEIMNIRIFNQNIIKSIAEDLLYIENEINQEKNDKNNIHQELISIKKRIYEELYPRGLTFDFQNIEYCINQIELIYSKQSNFEFGNIMIKWEAKDLTRFNVNDLQDLPFWLLSTSGYGLIYSISNVLRSEADSGAMEIKFDCYPVEKNSTRWGDNLVYKIINKDKPIGVIPCSPVFLEKIIKICGFEVNLEEFNQHQLITVKW